MSLREAIGFVGGAALVVGGVFTGNLGLIIAGASTIAATALGPDDLGARQQGVQSEIASTEAPLIVIYGKARVGPTIYETRVDPASADRKFLLRGGALCLGSQNGQGIEGVEKVQIGGRDAITPVSGDTIPFSNSPITTGVDSFWAGKLEYSNLSGAHDQAVPSDLLARFPSAWTATHRGRGVAHILLGATFDEEVYTSGIPRVLATVRGMRVFDPRDDSWGWSENPWLCALDYLLSRGYGKGAYRGISPPEFWGEKSGPASTGAFAQALSGPKPIAELGLSVGQEVSCGWDLKSAAGSDRLNHRLVWRNSGGSVIQTDTSPNVQSSSYQRAEIEGVTVPATAVTVVWEAVNVDGTETTNARRAELLKRPTALPFLNKVDLSSFETEANYADANVTIDIDGTPTGKTRHTVGGFLSTATDVDRNLQMLAASGRGDIIFEGGKFRATVRKGTATPTGFNLSPDNLVDDWRVRRLGLEDAPNLIRVAYTDQSREYQAHDVTWPEQDDFALLDADRGFDADVEVALPLTPDEATAKQIGMVLLREMREDATIECTTTHAAMELQVNDLIEVTLPTEGWTDKEFWVTGIQIRPDFLVDLVLREFDTDVYDLSDQSAEPSVPGTELPDPFSIDPPTGLILTSDATTALDTQDGQRLPRIKAEWTAPSDAFLSHYFVRYRVQTGPGEWINAPDPDDTDTLILIGPLTDGVTYDIEVYAVNTVGIRSTALTGSIAAATKASSRPTIEVTLVEVVAGTLTGSVDLDAEDYGDDIILDPYLRYDIQIDVDDPSAEGGTLYIYTNPDGTASKVPPLDGSDPESPANYDSKVVKASTPITITKADSDDLGFVLAPMFRRKEIGFLWLSDSGRRDVHVLSFGRDAGDRTIRGDWLRRFLHDEFGLDLTYGGSHRGLTLGEFEAEWLAGFLDERVLTPALIASTDGLTTLMDGEGRTIENLVIESTVTDDGARAINLFLAKSGGAGSPDDLDEVSDGGTFRKVVSIDANGRITAGSIKSGVVQATHLEVGIIIGSDAFFDGEVRAGAIVAATTFTAAGATFEGDVEIEAGSGNTVARIRTSGGAGQGAFQVLDGGSFGGELRAIGSNEVLVGGASSDVYIAEGGNGLQFFALSGAVGKQSVSGSTGGNAALQNLLTALANYNLITDNTT